MKALELQIQNQRIKGFVEKVGTQVWVHVNGKTVAIETSSQKSRRSRSGATGNSPEILAPMPGKVTSIKFKVGDKVAVGDVVIVMEAMKMEYSLKAQIAGVIKSINCQDQQQVTLSQVLATIQGET
jgi:acetyl/propionyl-CoA carboxylase alpha subunit